MANPSTQDPPKGSSEPTPCPPPTILQEKMLELEAQSKQQNVNDSNLQLAAINKINGEVEQAKSKYKDDYRSMKFVAAQLAEYAKQREAQVDAEVTQAEKKLIDEIVKCAQAHVVYLETQWKNARAEVPDLQKTWNLADIARQEVEDLYRKALDYKANQKDLETLQTQSTKEFDAGNFHGAYFLVGTEMKAKLSDLSTPKVFNEQLEKAAMTYFTALEDARKAKAAFDQKTDEEKKKKKAYEDVKTKLRENILKEIAGTHFDGLSPGEEPKSIPSPEQTSEKASGPSGSGSGARR
ncbi:hypothetical protein [Nitrospira sp. Nam80]